MLHLSEVSICSLEPLTRCGLPLLLVSLVSKESLDSLNLFRITFSMGTVKSLEFILPKFDRKSSRVASRLATVHRVLLSCTYSLHI